MGLAIFEASNFTQSDWVLESEGRGDLQICFRLAFSRLFFMYTSRYT